MAYRFSAAHLSALNLSPPDLIRAAGEVGFDHVGLRLIRTTEAEPHHDLIGDRALMRASLAALADSGISVWDVEVARMDPNHGPAFYAPMLDAAVELGARHVIAQTPDPDLNRATDRLARLCEMAAPLELKVDLEFISWYPDTGNVTRAAAMLNAVAADNAGMLVDMLQFDRSDSRLADLAALPREWFTWCHLCDVPAEPPASFDEMVWQGRCERLFPGDGGLDVRGILAAMPENLVCALEIPGETLSAEIGYTEYLRRALVRSKAFLAEHDNESSRT